jgi:type II pantothenate kinase
MSPFALLADPSTYIATDWNLSTDSAGRSYWCDFFMRHLRTVLEVGAAMQLNRGQSVDEIDRRTRDCAADFDARIGAFRNDPAQFERVSILTLDSWRDELLARHGFPDPFIDLKNRENERMLPLLPKICAQLDAIADERERFAAVIQGVFAGNIFDMGAAATAKAFLDGSPDFFAMRAKLKQRPWLIDDFDDLAKRILSRPAHRKAVFFIDNAGSDFLCGALPLMRLLAMRGTRIVLAANERPSLNDMTLADVRAWWPRILQVEPSVAQLDITLVSTGTGEPLIDLSRISDELNAAAGDADLVILEGMGRGVESNLDASFKTDALRIAMLKDPAVAARIGGSVFDLVCRFTMEQSASR